MEARNTSAASGEYKNRRYLIIDALRFVLAFWVVLGHSTKPFPLFAGVDPTTMLGHALTGAWRSVVFGPPAVIGFFVISGFCIHLPFRHDEKLLIGRFYLRRYTRILLPIMAAILFYRVVYGKVTLLGAHSVLWDSVMWSVLCEEMYYAVYPAIRALRWRIGWWPIIAISYVISEAIVLSKIHSHERTDFGPVRVALILAPTWFLGCYLAEISDSLKPLRSTPKILMWRAFAWFAGWACGWLDFHGGVYRMQTLAWFGLVAYLWIRKELEYGEYRKPAGLLVWAGAWSYSLYLLHPPALALVPRLSLPNLGYIFNWLILHSTPLVVAYVFALLIEFPSHRFARMIRLKPSPKRAKAVAGDDVAVTEVSQGLV